MGYQLLKRLMTTNRPLPEQYEEDASEWPASFFDHDDSLATKKALNRRSHTRSWVPAPKKKSSSPEPIDIRQLRSISRSPVPEEDENSSSTNLNLFDSQTSLHSTMGQSKPPSALNSRAPSPLFSAPDYSGNHNIQRISMPPKRPARPEQGLLLTPRSDSLPLNVLSTSTRSLSRRGRDQPESRPSSDRTIAGRNSGESEPMDQIILETNEAFKAVGTALERAASDSPRPVTPSARPPSPPPPLHKHSLSVPIDMAIENSHTRPLSIPRAPANVTNSPPPASAQGSLQKRRPKTSPKKRSPPNNGGRQWKSPLRAPRWALTGNVSEILSGQRFKKIEVEEMLTPSQIEDLSRNRARKISQDESLRTRASIESSRSTWSTNSSTPIEPFHLEDLPSRIGASGVMVDTAVMPTVQESTAAEDKRDLEATRTQNESLATEAWIDDAVSGDEAEDRRREKQARRAKLPQCDLPPPSRPPTRALPSLPSPPSPPPPPKNPARYKTLPLNKELPPTPPQAAELRKQAIPEVMVTTPDNKQLEPTTTQPATTTTTTTTTDPRLEVEEDDDFLYLKSTPFTLTKPLFQHGPITFSKAELGIGAKTMDDTLDWTAFQMAILGGAGDLFPDPSVGEEDKQGEDVFSWFESFGFETIGNLVPEDEPPSRSSTLSSSPSSIESDAEPPIPLGVEYPSGFWNSHGETLPTGSPPLNQGLKRWVGGRQKRLSLDDSPPPSPMMPLVVNAGEVGGPPEVVPMGYNLGHDLGDYLQWETEHVYASNYCASP